MRKSFARLLTILVVAVVSVVSYSTPAWCDLGIKVGLFTPESLPTWKNGISGEVLFASKPLGGSQYIAIDFGDEFTYIKHKNEDNGGSGYLVKDALVFTPKFIYGPEALPRFFTYAGVGLSGGFAGVNGDRFKKSNGTKMDKTTVLGWGYHVALGVEYAFDNSTLLAEFKWSHQDYKLLDEKWNLGGTNISIGMLF